MPDLTIDELYLEIRILRTIFEVLQQMSDVSGRGEAFKYISRRVSQLEEEIKERK